MKTNTNELLKDFFYMDVDKEFKGAGDAFLYGFTHGFQIMVNNWKLMREMEREEKRRVLG